MIKCPECGNEISEKEEVCPNCGYEVSNHYKEELQDYTKQSVIFNCLIIRDLG